MSEKDQVRVSMERVIARNREAIDVLSRHRRK